MTIAGTSGGVKTGDRHGGPTTYAVAVTGMTISGTVIATIAAGVATDLAGNTNTASTSADNTVTWNRATHLGFQPAADGHGLPLDDQPGRDASRSSTTTGSS